MAGSGNYYLQMNLQNFATGDNASADLILTANNGNDSTNYVNLGINNSGFSQTGTFGDMIAYDSYLYCNGGHLVIATQTTGKKVEIYAGGLLPANQKMEINTGGMWVNGTGNFFSGLYVSGISVLTGSTASFVTTTQSGALTGAFYPLNSNPSGYASTLTGIINSGFYTTITTGAGGLFTCSFALPEQYCNISGLTYSFSGSNTPASNAYADTLVYINNLVTGTSIVSFPSGWKNFNGGWPTGIYLGQSAILSLRAYGTGIGGSIIMGS